MQSGILIKLIEKELKQLYSDQINFIYRVLQKS